MFAGIYRDFAEKSECGYFLFTGIACIPTIPVIFEVNQKKSVDFLYIRCGHVVRDFGYTCNPRKFEIPALRFPRKVPVNPYKHLQRRKCIKFAVQGVVMYSTSTCTCTNHALGYLTTLQHHNLTKPKVA